MFFYLDNWETNKYSLRHEMNFLLAFGTIFNSSSSGDWRVGFSVDSVIVRIKES